MNSHASISVVRCWARLGVLVNCTPSREPVDIERLLIRTASALQVHPRLLSLVATWLSRSSHVVARHRLARLIGDECSREDQPALGLLLEEAIRLGATRDLRVARDRCAEASSPRPLYRAFADDPILYGIAKSTASAASQQWGVWAPEAELRSEAIRPVAWIVERVPELRERAIRRGDLRCTLVEVLRSDFDGPAPSVASLARASGATRAAVERALRALVTEGAVVVRQSAVSRRDMVVERVRVA